MSEPELKNYLKQHKEHIMQVMRLKEIPARMIMPLTDVAFEKKGIFKHCRQPIVKMRINQESKRTRSKSPENIKQL